MQRSLIVSWQARRITANTGDGTGWTWCGTPTPPATIPTIRCRRFTATGILIDAFNARHAVRPFVQDQIAGDILAKQGPPRLCRTHRRHRLPGPEAPLRHGPYEFWPLSLEDAIDTTGRAFLGLTLRFARCHDHKFDPVTQEDYYALYGMFASTQFPWAGAEEFESQKAPRQHFVPLVPAAEAAPRLQAYRQKVEQLRDSAVRQAEKVATEGPGK